MSALDKVIAGRVITKWLKHKKKLKDTQSPTKRNQEERKSFVKDSYDLESERGFNNFVDQVKDMESIAIHEEDSNAQFKISNTNLYTNDQRYAQPTLMTKEQPEKTLNDDDCTFGADSLRKDKSGDVNQLFKDDQSSNLDGGKDRPSKEMEVSV